MCIYRYYYTHIYFLCLSTETVSDNKTLIVTSTSNTRSVISNIIFPIAETRVPWKNAWFRMGKEIYTRWTWSILSHQKRRKCSTHKTNKKPMLIVMETCQRTQESTERAPNGQSWNNVNKNKPRNTNYNIKYKINIHKSILIHTNDWVSQQKRDKPSTWNKSQVNNK